MRGDRGVRDFASLEATVAVAREAKKLTVVSGRADRRGRRSVQYRIDYAGRCERPVTLRWRPRWSNETLAGMKRKNVRAYHVQLRASCRRCKDCLRRKAFVWGERAMSEFDSATHTWFATIEWSPREHAVSDAEVQAEMRTLAQPVGESSYPRFRRALFKARVKVMSKAVTRWLESFREKRRRALGRAPRFSYLLVAEEHKGVRKKADGSSTSGLLKGRPHFHLLVHEHGEGELIPRDQWYLTKKGDVRADDKSDIREAWPFEGFTQFEKLDADEGWRCRYICKYLGKEEQHWRIRASVRYGERAPSSNEVLQLARPNPDTEVSGTSSPEGARKENVGSRPAPVRAPASSSPLRQGKVVVPTSLGSDVMDEEPRPAAGAP